MSCLNDKQHGSLEGKLSDAKKIDIYNCVRLISAESHHKHNTKCATYSI